MVMVMVVVVVVAVVLVLAAVVLVVVVVPSLLFLAVPIWSKRLELLAQNNSHYSACLVELTDMSPVSPQYHPTVLNIHCWSHNFGQSAVSTHELPTAPRSLPSCPRRLLRAFPPLFSWRRAPRKIMLPELGGARARLRHTGSTRVYRYMYMYIYTYVNLYRFVNVHMYMYTKSCIYIYIYLHIRIYNDIVHSYVAVHMPVNMCASM